MLRRKKYIIHSLVDREVELTGDVHFSGGLQVLGRISGRLLGSGPLSVFILQRGARVQGSIEAEHVIIDGEVTGPVLARRTLIVRSNGLICGPISYMRMSVEDGGRVHGMLELLPAPAAPAKSAWRRWFSWRKPE